MDAPPISPVELLCLGSSLAFSGLFYYQQWCLQPMGGACLMLPWKA